MYGLSRESTTNCGPGEMLLCLPQEGFSMHRSFRDEFYFSLGRFLNGFPAVE